MTQSGRAAWSVVTALAVTASLWSLVPADGSPPQAGCCLPMNGGCFDGFMYCDNGSFSLGQVCTDDNAGCRDPLMGCCDFDDGSACSDNWSEIQCQGPDMGFVVGGFCDRSNNTAMTSGFAPAGMCVTVTPTPTETPTLTPTATPTATPTETPTNTPIPDGGECIDPVDCMSGNCVDDVCCDTACDSEGEACNLAGAEGTCTAAPATMAPVASNRSLIVAMVGLLAVGVFALLRRRA